MPDGSQPAATLGGDRAADAGATELTAQLARKLRIANDHREKLFNFVILVVAASLVIVAIAVACVGLGWLRLETPVMVAFIAALAVQSFVLIGFLARGLFIEASGSNTPPPEVD